MPFFDFMANVPSGPENLERLGVHLLPFQVERPLERLPDFPSEIVVPSRWNGRNGNIVPFQSFFYVVNLERQPALRPLDADRCRQKRGFPAMKNAATALQLFPLRATATGLQPACHKVAATDGLQLRAQNRPETRMNPRVAMQPRPCNRPTLLQRLRCTFHPRGKATPATVATKCANRAPMPEAISAWRLRRLAGRGRLAVPMPLGRAGWHLQAIFWRRTWRASQSCAGALVGRFLAARGRNLEYT